MAHESGLRTNASLARQSRGYKSWFVNQDNDPGSSAGADKHSRDIR